MTKRKKEFENDLPKKRNYMSRSKIPPNRVIWKNTFHMRQMTLSSINSSGQAKQTLSAQAAGTKLRGRCMTSASRSLDLLRLNIQTLINKEIDAVLKKYLDKFFRPAIENIRNNLGENSVTEDNIRVVCRQILEDAKNQYYSGSQSVVSSPFSDSGTPADSRIDHPTIRNSLSLFHNKKKELDTDSEASQSLVKTRKKSVRTVANGISGTQGSIKVMKVESVKKEGPKWDPNRIVKSTLFIMGARANKVLGFGQTRGRLYTKHPELLKYSGDAEDKEWLSRHNLMPPTGGIAYLLVLDDVRELAESEEYRHNPNVILTDLKGFEAPEFMLKKIRAFIAHSRSNGRDPNYPYPYKENGDINNHYNYNMGCSSIMMTPPATVSGSAFGTHYKPLEQADCSSFFKPRQSNFPSLTTETYGNGTYCNEFSHSYWRSSEYTTNGNVVSHSATTSLLVSPMENENSQETP